MSGALSVTAYNNFGLNAYNRTNLVSRQDEKRIDIPTSGYNFKPVANNAAELSVSEKIRMQTSGLARNTYYEQARISDMQVAGQTLDRVTELLGRITELTAQVVKADNSSEDRRSIQGEVMKLLYEIDKVSNEATFNVDKASAETTPAVNTQDLGIENIDVSIEEGAVNAMEAVSEATEYVTQLRDNVTASQTWLENKVLGTVKAKGSSEETIDMSKAILDIFSKADEAVLAQANQSNRGVMSLLS